jgi:hypothetical protein
MKRDEAEEEARADRAIANGSCDVDLAHGRA